MIPIISIIFLSNSLLTGLYAWSIWRRRGKDIFKNKALTNLFFLYIAAMLFFLIEGLPSMLTGNTVIIERLYIVSDSIIALLPIFLTSMILQFFPLHESWKKISMAFNALVAMFAVFYFTFNQLNFHPAKPYIFGPFVINTEGANPTLLIIHGLIIAVSLIIFILTFIIKGWQNSDLFVRRRARLTSLGGIFLFLATFLIYIDYVIIPAGPPTHDNLILPMAIVATLFYDIGFLFPLYLTKDRPENN